MSVQVGSCYYHEGKAAVGVCSQCGAAICRECAVKDDRGRIICVSCGNRNLKEEHGEYRRVIKERGGIFTNGKEFVKPSIIGLILVVAISILYLHQNIGTITHAYDNGFIFSILADNLVSIIVMAYTTFSIPFAVIWLDSIRASRYTQIRFIVCIWIFKIFIAYLIGWIIFTFYWIRFIFIKIRSKKKMAEKWEDDSDINLKGLP